MQSLIQVRTIGQGFRWFKLYSKVAMINLETQI